MERRRRLRRRSNRHGLGILGVRKWVIVVGLLAIPVEIYLILSLGGFNRVSVTQIPNAGVPDAVLFSRYQVSPVPAADRREP